MNETLARLLLRLSEGGEPAVLWGRTAKPYMGREFEALLNQGVLVEDAPAVEWPVCGSCECGFDTRPVRMIKDRYVACCPMDHRGDEILDEQDRRNFRIATSKLVRTIARCSGFEDDLPEPMPGLWQLGPSPNRSAVFLGLAANAAQQPGVIATFKQFASEARMLIAPSIDAATEVRFAEAGIQWIKLLDIVGKGSASSPFAIDQGLLLSDKFITPRLIFEPAGSVVTLDGIVHSLPPRSYGLLALLAETVLLGGGITTRRDIEERLWPHSSVDKRAAADAIRDLRHKLGDTDHQLIENRPTQGYLLNLVPEAVRVLRGPGTRFPITSP